MGILTMKTDQAGMSGVLPRVIYIDTDNTIAEVTAAGYLNSAVSQGRDIREEMIALVSIQASPGAKKDVTWLEVAFDGTDWSLVPTATPGSVVLPTTADRLAHFDDTGGTLSDTAADVTNAGDIYAGLSGTEGAFRSYPATAAKGYLEFKGVANTGDTKVVVSNAAHGQATVASIPDGGQATTEFIIADSASTQHITSGNLQIDTGNLLAGSDGNNGFVESYPATSSNGKLIYQAVDNSAGDFSTTVSNAASVGQDQTLSIPDSGQATSEFIIADSGGTQHITSGSLQVDTGNLLAGSDGNNGFFESYPTTASNGKLVYQAVDNSAGDFSTTVSNAASVGQDQTLSIPDSGQATSEFIIADSGGTQHITSGNLQVDTGNLLAGSDGNNGFFESYPATGSNGKLIYQAVDNSAGDFSTTVSNAASVGQDQTLSIPDSGQATSEFIIADSGGTQTITSGDLDISNGDITALNLLSGTYTPTITDTTNVASSTAYLTQYMRVGDVVTVSGVVDITASSGTTFTLFEIELPIASNLSSFNQAAGSGAVQITTTEILACSLYGNSTNDTIEGRFIAPDTSSHSVSFTFTYVIV